MAMTKEGIQPRRSSRARMKFYGLLVIMAVAVFTLGVFTGNGHIRFFGARTNQTGLPARLDFTSVNEVYDALRQNYNGTLTEQQVLDGLKHGLANSTSDPYTQFFTASGGR